MPFSTLNYNQRYAEDLLKWREWYPPEFVVDANRVSAQDLSCLIGRAVSDSTRAALAAPLQRGALQLASGRARAVQMIQSMLRELLSDAEARDLSETTNELMRTASRLAELRRANNAMVADAQRAIEAQNGPNRRAAEMAEALAKQLGQELDRTQRELASSMDRARELESALALSQQHIENLEAMLNTRSARIASAGARAAGKLRRRREP